MAPHLRPEDRHGGPSFAQHQPVVIRLISERRTCATCGYDLRGQQVRLDPHYGWTITRCPECGSVWPLQAKRAGALWPARRGAVIALAWIVLVLGTLGAFGIALFAVSESAMVVWVAGPDWYSNAYFSPLAGLVETLWTIPVALIGWGLIFGLMPDLQRRQRWQAMGFVVLVILLSWGVYHGPFLGSISAGRYWSPYGDATFMILALARPGSLVTSLIVIAETVAVMGVVRPIARWGLARFAPTWVVLALQGLWRADGLEPPRDPNAVTPQSFKSATN